MNNIVIGVMWIEVLYGIFWKDLFFFFEMYDEYLMYFYYYFFDLFLINMVWFF